MTRKQYAVHTVRDEPVRLRDQLDHIAAEGGRVVSVIWQPARQVIFRRDGSVRPTLSLAKPLRTAQPRRQRRLGEYGSIINLGRPALPLLISGFGSKAPYRRPYR